MISNRFSQHINLRYAATFQYQHFKVVDAKTYFRCSIVFNVVQAQVKNIHLYKNAENLFFKLSGFVF